MSDDQKVMATGIAAGALWYCLRDLNEKVDRLPPGDLRDTWVNATGLMTDTLSGAMNAHDRMTDGASS